MFLKVAQIVATSVYTYINLFFKIAQKVTNQFWPLLQANLTPRTFKSRPIWSHWRERVCMVFVDKIEIGRKKCV